MTLKAVKPLWQVEKPSSVECPASRFAAELLAETGSE